MKTFLVVTLYVGMVATLDLGGAVWNQIQSARRARASVAMAAPVQPAQAGSANHALATIPSDT